MALTLNERDRRLDGARAAMRRDDIEALIVVGTAGTGIPFNGNFAYLTGRTLFYASAALYLPLDGEPVSFIPGENQFEDAKRAGWIEHLVLSRQPFADCCRHIAEARRRPERIGVSSLAVLPSPALEEIRGAAPGAELGEAGPLILAMRDVKSEEEIAIARRAGEVADIGFFRSLEILGAGLNGFEWKAEAERVMTAAGADGGFNMLGVGRAGGDSDIFRGFVVPPTARAFEDGDLALLEISPRVEGYYSQIVRLVSLGAPEADIAAAHAACVAAKQKAIAALRLGARFDEVMAPIERGLAAAGLGAKFVATAHTIGLDLSETVINPRTPGEIAAGMVVTVHPMIELGEWRQLFTGETYAVGDSGCVCLNRSEDRIYVV